MQPSGTHLPPPPHIAKQTVQPVHTLKKAGVTTHLPVPTNRWAHPAPLLHPYTPLLPDSSSYLLSDPHPALLIDPFLL